MAQAVGEVKEEPLHALLKTSKEHLNLIENAGDRTSQDYKVCCSNYTTQVPVHYSSNKLVMYQSQFLENRLVL